jgi:hypothetical protein
VGQDQQPALVLTTSRTTVPRTPRARPARTGWWDDLAVWFGKGGKLEAFDGLEFDVMFNETRGDTDGDGVADDGVVGGVNRYGIGMVAFARQLRERLGRAHHSGRRRAGAGGARSQRAFGYLNGIESEGWPNLDDWAFDDWSGGLNRFSFWNANAFAPPSANMNHKWVEPVPGKPGEHRDADVPFARHRLAFAAAQLTDAVITYASQPPNGDAGRVRHLGRIRLRCGEPARVAGPSARPGRAAGGGCA